MGMNRDKPLNYNELLDYTKSLDYSTDSEKLSDEDKRIKDLKVNHMIREFRERDSNRIRDFFQRYLEDPQEILQNRQTQKEFMLQLYDLGIFDAQMAKVNINRKENGERNWLF